MKAKELWLRLGVTAQITPEEEAAIFSNSSQLMADAIHRIIAEGRLRLDGDTYVPEPTVEEYNAVNGTDYEPGDYGCEL